MPKTSAWMTNLSHTIRKFNRFELKYLVSIQVAKEFKRALEHYLEPDQNGGALGIYAISSLYYDNPSFRFYWEKIEGIKYRRKLRIRYYETPDQLQADSPVFVEIKQRLNRVTQKRRVCLPYQDALQLCNQRTIPDHSQKDTAVIDEIVHMLWYYDLRPASITRYSRQALIGTDYDIGLRVTFDKNLSYAVYHSNQGDFQFPPSENSLLLFPPNWVVIEIKVNERIPYWLTELVARHNLNLVRISKYCRSIELGQGFFNPAWRFIMA